MTQKRVQALKDLLAAQRLDGAALVPGANLFYFTGYRKSLSERPLVMFIPVDGSACVLLPEFEAPEAEELLPDGVELYTYDDTQGHEKAFQEVSRTLKLAGTRLGVESAAMRILEYRQIEACSPGVRISDAGEVFTALRVRKDAAEIEAMRAAGSLNEQVFLDVIQHICPGRTERQIAANYQISALQAGSDGLAFAPIVVSGPNTAFPHANPGNRRIEQGEFITMDCGVVSNGYCSDITRTFATGPVSDDLKRIYETVRLANETGREFARPGITAQELDRATRRVIVDAGYGQYFVHRTGHGLGLEVHEAPYIVEGNELILQPGMVFTIEPGIYIPGLGGVRIEDNVFITGTGCESLTDLPRDLVFAEV